MRRTTSVFLLIAALVAAASAPAAASRGTRANPYRIRTLVRPPDSEGWKLRVNKSVPNATRSVLKWNKFNPPPRAGDQFFIINITLAYSGGGFDIPFAPTRLSAVGRSNITYTATTDSCGGIPEALHFRSRVRSGRNVTGNICFSVSKNDVRGLLLKYESEFSSNQKQVFFRLR